MAPNNVMKNVETINEIIAIEAAAQELVKKVELEQAELPSKISAILDAYEAQNNEKAAERIKCIRISEENLTTEKIELINKTHEEKLGKLKQIADENMDSWVDRIYSFITTPTEI